MDNSAQFYTSPSKPKLSLPEKMQHLVNFISSRPKIFYPIFLLLLVIVGAYALKTFFRSPTRTATVVGIGKLKVKPEKAIITFSVVEESFSQEDAILKGEEKFNAILGQVNTYNPVSVEKSAYQIVPKSQSSVVATKVVASPSFQYVNAAKVTVSDLTSIQNIITSLYGNGAAAVSQVRYIPKDEEAMDREVRKLAVKNAREHVGDIAKASGTRVGKVITIQEGGSTGQSGSSVTGANQADTKSLASPGEIELQATVTVLYELH